MCIRDSPIAMEIQRRKRPCRIQLGGEDGLNETPIVNSLASDETHIYYGMPSWSVWSVLSQYQLKENVVFNLGLRNIFDLHYRTFGSGISSEGRSFQLGVKVKF